MCARDPGGGACWLPSARPVSLLVCGLLCHLPSPTQASTPFLLVCGRPFYLQDGNHRLETELANVSCPWFFTLPLCGAFLLSFAFRFCSGRSPVISLVFLFRPRAWKGFSRTNCVCLLLVLRYYFLAGYLFHLEFIYCER